MTSAPLTPAYSSFASIYDRVMEGVDYETWASYVEALLRQHGFQAVTVVDLCCGTGSSSLPFARRGYRVTGIDRSEAMIDLAREKAARAGLPVTFVWKDVTALLPLAEPLPPAGSVDLVVSLFDSLNYVLELADLEKVFRGVRELLRPGGAFIFDLNSEEKLASMKNEITLLEGEGWVLFWRNQFLEKERIWQIILDGFLRRGEGWERFREIHREKAHPTGLVRERLVAGGLEVLATYHAYTLSPVREGTDRIFYVARRPPVDGVGRPEGGST